MRNISKRRQYSIPDLAYSYGHQEAYESTFRHDNQSYAPHSVDDPDPSYDDDDTRPMLEHQHTEASSSSVTVNEEGTNWAKLKPKMIPLFKGNLVLDCPVPTKLFNQLSEEQQENREFKYMRYSAATCDPKEFLDERFTLRQNLYQTARRVELFIVVTMYNEEDDLLARTLMGIFQNVNYMENMKKGTTWGKDSWKKIVVCIVSDGIKKINPRSRALLAGLGVFQAGIDKDEINGKPTAAHIFEVCCEIEQSNFR